MTAPRQITASMAPELANMLATSGNSKAPGAHTTVTVPRSHPAFFNTSSAPVSRRSVMPPLNSAQANPIRGPEVPAPGPDPAPSTAAPSTEEPTRAAIRSLAPSGSTVRSDVVIETLQQVTRPVALGPEILDVLGIGGRRDVHPFHDVQTEPFEAPTLGRIVGHEPHGGHTQVHQDLCPDAVLT